MTAPQGPSDGRAGDDRWEVPDGDRLRRVRGPQRLDDLLAGFVGRRGWRDRVEAVSVFSRWQQIVGPELDRRCEPVRLAGGLLVVRVQTQAWAAQIRYLLPRIRERANTLLADQQVERVRLVVGPLQGQARTEGR